MRRRGPRQLISGAKAERLEKRRWMDFKCRRTLHYRLSTSLHIHLLPIIELKSSLVTHDRGCLLPIIKGDDEILANCPFVSPISDRPRSLNGAEDSLIGWFPLQGALPAIAFHCSDSSGESLSM
jgi:hypothetical protein